MAHWQYPEYSCGFFITTSTLNLRLPPTSRFLIDINNLSLSRVNKRGSRRVAPRGKFFLFFPTIINQIVFTGKLRSQHNLLVVLVKVRFLKIFWCLGVSSTAMVGGLGLEGTKESLKRWIGVGSVGCTFCDGTRVFGFEPVLIKKLTI